MNVKPQDLSSQLSGQLANVYFVSGDETLLVQEACDQIIAAARAMGFSERSVMYAETGFRWHDVLQDAASMSLFADKKIIDIRVPGSKFDKEASEVLRQYVERLPEDTLLLIRCARLDARQRQSAWFKALDSIGVMVLVWPVGNNELPRWMNQRLHQAGLKLAPDALNYLLERIEGNLLAAVQEIAKLKLLNLPEPVNLADLMAAVEDASHYDVFELIDAVFAGDGARVSRMVQGLREEGVALFAILGAFNSQIRRLTGNARMPPHRQRLVQGFLLRINGATDAVLSQTALIDAQGKGALFGDAWLSLERLLVRLAGERQLPTNESYLPYLKRG